MTMTIKTDRTLIRAGARSTRYVLARVTAPEAPRRGTRLPINVALVLDRSGSMADERKFSLARDAVEQALRMLGPEEALTSAAAGSAAASRSPSSSIARA